MENSHGKAAMDNRPLSQIYSEIAHQWVDADAAASLLEDCKSAFLSQKMQMHSMLPVSKAEALVKASPEWEDYIEKMVNARKQANLLKVKLETIKMRHSEWQSEEANNRAQARL